MDQPGVILPDGFMMQDAASRLDGVDKFVAQIAIGPEADIHRGSAQHFFPPPAEITQIVFIDVNDQTITDPRDRGRKRAGVEGNLETLLFGTPCRLCLKQQAIAPHPHRLVNEAKRRCGGSEQADGERNDQVRRCLPLGHRFIARHFGNQMPGGFGNRFDGCQHRLALIVQTFHKALAAGKNRHHARHLALSFGNAKMQRRIGTLAHFVDE